MKTTADFLDALRVKLDLPSDGRLAVYLGMQRQQMSRYRTLGHSFDDSMSLRVAEILELDPAYVLACMQHQREKNEAVKRQWQRIAERMAIAATLAGLAIALPSLCINQDCLTLANLADPSNLYIMSNNDCLLTPLIYLLPLI